MAPYFEQYKGALRRGLNARINSQEELIKKTQTKIQLARARIARLEKQIISMQAQTKKLSGPLDTVRSLPEIDIFIAGPDNGNFALSDFANSAVQTMMEAKTAEEKNSAQQKLSLLLDASQLLTAAGIKKDKKVPLDPSRKFHLDIEKDIPNKSSDKRSEIIFDGERFILSPNQLAVLRFLESKEGEPVSYQDIVDALGLTYMRVLQATSFLTRELGDYNRNKYFNKETDQPSQITRITYHSPDRARKRIAQLQQVVKDLSVLGLNKTDSSKSG